MLNQKQRQEAIAQKKLHNLKVDFEETERSGPRHLVELRRDCAMSVSEVAAEIGLGYEYYRQLERGKFMPSEKTKATICQIFSCQIDDIDWPKPEEVIVKSPKRQTFQTGKTYVFIPIRITSGEAKQRETMKSRKKRLRYLRDAGVNHVFEDLHRGGIECFIDAQIMDYAVTAA